MGAVTTPICRAIFFVTLGGSGASGQSPASDQSLMCGILIQVNKGDYLIFDASGQWQDGSSTSEPDGQAMSWADNFLNLTDLGVGRYEAKTSTPHWDALVGYIGPTDPSDPLFNPPERGSYASPVFQSRPYLREQAMRVFPVFPKYDPSRPHATHNVMQVKQAGRLWLTFNADAYSNYIVDNSGSVTVTVQRDSNSRPVTPDLKEACDAIGYIPGQLKVVEWVCKGANLLVGGSIIDTLKSTLPIP
jgi:hypothetical protein